MSLTGKAITTNNQPVTDAFGRTIGPGGVIETQVNPTAPKRSGNPYGQDRDIRGYESSTFEYPVELMQQRQMMAQSFDPYRQAAQQTVASGVASGEATAASALAASGGLSAADRAALKAQSQRQGVNLQQGAQAAQDQMQAQNLYQTNQANAEMSQNVLDTNQQIMNARAKDMAAEYEKKATNIYEQRLKDAWLERQLEAAREIARKQREL